MILVEALRLAADSGFSAWASTHAIVRLPGPLSSRRGAEPQHITAYLIIAHPFAMQQDIDASMHYAHSLGLRVMLSEFSPIPGTPDGERCRQWVHLDEPLWHNKTAFTAHRLGLPEVQRLKRLCRQLNQQLGEVEYA